MNEQPIIDGRNNLGNTETINNCIKREFVDAVAEMVSDSLDINYRDKRNFTALLKSSIKDKIIGRSIKDEPGGLLEQYLHHELIKIIPTFIRVFDLDDSVDIVESHAVHAKFNEVIEAIIKNEKD